MASFAFADNAVERKDVSVVSAEGKNVDFAGELDAYDVSVMRFSDSIFDVSSSAQNISAKKIEESGLSSLPEILRRYGDVYFRSFGTNLNNAEISMRGFGVNSTQRVLVLMDGQRMNRMDMATINWSQIPIEEIENIEVIRGAQTALYGNHASGGVIKISTKKWNQPNNVKFGGFYGTNEEYSVYGRANVSTEDYFFSADANYYHNGGYIDHYSNWAKSVGVSGGVRLDSKNDLTLYANVGNEFISWGEPVSYEEMMRDPQYSSAVSSQNKIDYISVSTGWENSSDIGEGSAQLGLNMRDKEISYISGGGNYGELWTLSFSPRYRIKMGENDESYIEGGVDFYYDDFKVDGKGYSYTYWGNVYTMNPYIAEISRTTFAPWLGGKIQLDDTFSINVGGRYEGVVNDAKYSGGNYTPYKTDELVNGFAAQVGFNAKLNETANVYFRFDQIYKYPSIDERFSIWNLGDRYTNPNLNPECGQNYEIGTNFAKEGFFANIALFYMALNDEISCNPFTGLNTNIGDTDRFGAEVRLAYSYEDMVGLSTSWQFVSAKFSKGEFDGKTVPLVPSIASSTILWVQPVDFFKLEFAYQWTSEQYMDTDFSNASRKMPDSWSLDITANFFVGENIRAFVSVTNVTDETYALMAVDNSSWGGGSSWYAAAGRLVRAGVEIKF